MIQRGDGQPTWALSPYEVSVSYGQPGAAGQGADWFGPLAPITPPQVSGRQWDYPSGYNLATTPRIYEPVSFHTLRGLAEGYDLLRLVIETRKDQMERQRWRIRPRDPKFKRKSTAIDAAMSTRIAAVESFLQKPDGVTRWKTWASIGLAAVVILGWVLEAAIKWAVATILAHFQ